MLPPRVSSLPSNPEIHFESQSNTPTSANLWCPQRILFLLFQENKICIRKISGTATIRILRLFRLESSIHYVDLVISEYEKHETITVMRIDVAHH